MNVIETIRAHRPGWLDGFAQPAADVDLKDYTVRVLESTRARAKDEVSKTSIDEVRKLAEASRGMKEIEHILESVKSGKMDEAVKLLESWIVKYPATEGGSQFLFPYQEASMKVKEGEAKSSTEVSKVPSSTEVQEALTGCKTALDGAKKGMKEGEAGKLHEEAMGHIAMAEKRMKAAEGESEAEAKKEHYQAAMKHIGDAHKVIADAHAEPDGDEGEVEGEGEGEGETNPAEEKKMEAIKAKEAELKVKESELLVKEKLLTSGLTTLGQSRVAKMFKAKESVKAEEVDAAIAEEKAYVASFKEGEVKGLGNAHSEPSGVKVGADQADKYKKAWDGFFHECHNELEKRAVLEAYLQWIDSSVHVNP
jgi:hypothetical protein